MSRIGAYCNRALRCRPTYGLSFLLLSIAIISVWLGVMVHGIKCRERAVATVISKGGVVMYDNNVSLSSDEMADREWQRLIGRDYFHSVISINLRGSDSDDDTLHKLVCLTHVRSIDMSCTSISDSGLRALSKLEYIEDVSLANTHVTNAAIQQLRDLPRLRSLDLSGTRVTDEGMHHFNASYMGGGAYSRLELLDIHNTSISDKGIRDLTKSLPPLRDLNVADTSVTPEGVNWLRREWPLCNIVD